MSKFTVDFDLALFEICDVIRLFPFALLAFKIWMLVDAIRRREPYYWLLIIFFIPFGSVIYFFMVKIGDYRLAEFAASFRSPPSVDALRTAYRRTPSLVHRIELADGLVAAQQYAEAADLFTEALAQEPDNPDALFGFAEARLGLGDHAPAIEALSRLLESHRGFRNYRAWPLLAHALWDDGQQERCLTLVRRLFEISPRLNHAVLVAHYLMLAGETAEAHALLTTALDDHRDSPRYVRRGTFRVAREASRMRKECEASSVDA